MDEGIYPLICSILGCLVVLLVFSCVRLKLANQGLKWDREFWILQAGIWQQHSADLSRLIQERKEKGA